MDIANLLGATITLALGLLGLVFPNRAAAFVGLQPVSPAGRSEFRATYGGLFAAAGLFPMITQLPSAYLLVSMCWLGAALGRVASIMIDRLGDTKNWQGVGFECGIGLLLLVGEPYLWLTDGGFSP